MKTLETTHIKCPICSNILYYILPSVDNAKSCVCGACGLNGKISKGLNDEDVISYITVKGELVTLRIGE